MFRQNPGFQLAFILLILFISYVLQVKNQPYMSSAQRSIVLADHRMKVVDGHPLHVKIQAQIKQVLRGKRKYARNKQDMSLKRLSQFKSFGEDRKNKRTEREYFFDYNTVEQALLSSAVFVSLSGVMFETIC